MRVSSCQFCALHTHTEEIWASMSFFFFLWTGFKLLASFIQGDASLSASPGRAERWSTRGSLYSFCTHLQELSQGFRCQRARKKIRVEMLWCKKNEAVKDGVVASGCFRKACLHLVQVSGLCLLNLAVGGDHKCVIDVPEVSLMSLASALAGRKTLLMTSIGNSELCYDFCHGSGHVMSRCLCGICTVASLGFPSGLWGVFLCFTSRLFCDISVLATTSPLQRQQKEGPSEQA